MQLFILYLFIFKEGNIMKLKKNFISCFLLFTILCQFFIPTFVKADIGYTQNQEGLFPTDFTEIDGLIRNYKNYLKEFLF